MRSRSDLKGNSQENFQNPRGSSAFCISMASFRAFLAFLVGALRGISLGAFGMSLGVGVNEVGSIFWRSCARRSAARQLGGSVA